MARRKVKLAFISNEVARKATYKKRKNGILKKLNEITTLCGIVACAIIFNPFDSQIEVWPNLEVAKEVIERYADTSVIDESKNVNQESFLMQSIAKAEDRLKKMRQDNHEKELTIAVYNYMQDKTLPNMSIEDVNDLNKLPNMSFEDANDLNKIIEKKLNEIKIKLAKLN